MKKCLKSKIKKEFKKMQKENKKFYSQLIGWVKLQRKQMIKKKSLNKK